jgi:hypothetical protein
MSAASPLVPDAHASSRASWLWLIVALAAAALWLYGPIPQWADYHAFADQRAWLGVPNAANVLSNLPFLAVGLWGLWRLRGSASATATAWRVFSIALACTAAGSAIYHWAPSNATLVGDRLPIAWACTALLCAFLAERVQPRWCDARVLGAALFAATLSVAYWWIGERGGHGDLRPYLVVQFLPGLLIPAALWLGLAPTFEAATPASAWWALLGFYAAAKLMEMADHAVFDYSIAFVSGHTLKHLLAAAGAAWLLAAATRGRDGRAADQLR